MPFKMTSFISHTQSWEHDLSYLISRPSDDLLLQELKLGHLTAVLNYLRNGGDANKSYEHGSLLHYAIVYKHLSIICALLGAGASPNVVDSRDISALQMAVHIGNLDIVKSLLDAGANPNFRSSSNESNQPILHEAVIHSSNEMVELLMNHGADINAIDDRRESALYHAILKMKGDPRTYGEVEYCLEFLISRGAEILNVGFGSKSYLFDTVLQCGTMRAVQIFLDNGINLQDFRNEPLLFHAFENKREEVLNFLLGSNIFNVDQRDSEGRTFLQHVIINNRKRAEISSLVKVLLERGANVNAVDNHGIDVLYYAVLKMKEGYHGDSVTEALLKPLILRGAQVMNPGPEGPYKSFETAVRYGTVAAVQTFLDNGINLNNLQIQPLFSMALENTKHLSLTSEVFRLLVKVNPSNINQRDFDGHTLLQHAIERGLPLTDIELILHHDADPNIPDEAGQTSLHIALSRGDGLFAELLFAYGAHFDSDDYERIPSAPTLRNRNPRRRHTSVIKPILSYVAQLDGLGRDVGPLVQQIIASNGERSRLWYVSCKSELELLRSSTISSNISYYDILTKRDIYGVVDNQYFLDALNDPGLDERFPIYSKRIKRRFDWIREKHKLMPEAMVGLSHIMNFNVEGTQLVAYNILSRLQSNDLRQLARVPLL